MNEIQKDPFQIEEDEAPPKGNTLMSDLLSEHDSGSEEIGCMNITQIKRAGGTNIIHSFRNPNLPFKKFRIRKSNVTKIDYNDPEIDKILNSETSNTQFVSQFKYDEVFIFSKVLREPNNFGSHS